MDTSQDYYRTVMRQFKTYGRGRSLEQFCRDEAVDYRWLSKAKSLYGTPENDSSAKAGKKTKSKAPDLIQLHYEDKDHEISGITGQADTAEQAAVSVREENTETPETVATGKWRVSCLRLVTPSGEEMEIKSFGTSAVMELLATLARNHA